MELRPGYKRTEVGVIPEDWDCCRIGDLTSKEAPICYGIVQPGPYVRTGVPVLAIKNLNTGYTTDIHRSSAEIERPYARSRVKFGDILVSVKGTTGRVGKVPEQFVGNISRDIARVRLSGGNVPDFWLQMLQSDMVQGCFGVSAVGTTRMELSIGILKQIAVARPPEEQQEAIAGALSDADALIESLEQLIAKKRHVKQGAMQELLRPKDGWSRAKLGSLGVFLKGTGIKKDESLSGDIPCVRYGEIYTKHVDFIRRFYSWISSAVAATAVRLCEGDILFAGSGETKTEIGKCVAFVGTVEPYAGGDIVILRPRNADSIYLGYYLNTAQINRQKASRGQGDAVVHIGAAALADITIDLPALAEQTAIAEVLSDMDAEIAALETKLTKARQIKQGMMHNLLTGRIRLV